MSEQLTAEVLAEFKAAAELALASSAIHDMGCRCSMCDAMNHFEQLCYAHAPALIAAAEREQNRRTRQATHWDGCWREHRDCAVVKVEEQQKRIAELEGALISAAEREKEQANQICHMAEAADESLEQIGVLNTELERAQKRISELDGAKAHMNYCRTLVPLDDGDVLADGIEKLRTRIAEMEAAAEQVLASAFPLPTEHPAMFAAFGRLQQALKGGAK